MRIILLAAIAAIFMTTLGANMSTNNKSFYEFTVKSISAKETALSQYKTKAILVVNVASKCGFTGQYKGLEALYNEYKDKGFTIIGFPSNDFGAQEPGSNEEIATFCQRNYGVTFPMMAKIPVKGNDKHPIYSFLTSGDKPGEVGWNFEKFLINEDGKVVERYKSRVSPNSKELRADIDSLINN
jgi:glutathione peroxidase